MNFKIITIVFLLISSNIFTCQDEQSEIAELIHYRIELVIASQDYFAREGLYYKENTLNDEINEKVFQRYIRSLCDLQEKYYRVAKKYENIDKPETNER